MGESLSPRGVDPWDRTVYRERPPENRAWTGTDERVSLHAAVTAQGRSRERQPSREGIKASAACRRNQARSTTAAGAIAGRSAKAHERPGCRLSLMIRSVLMQALDIITSLERP